MKKSVFLLFILFLFPLSVFAESFKVNDLTIDIDSKDFYIFTKESLTKDNNEENIDELGISTKELVEFMNENNIYLDSVKLAEDEKDCIEVFIKIIPIKAKNVKNLHNYSNSEIKELENELFNEYETSNNAILKYNDYKYIYAEYNDLDYNILQYVTIINGNYYSLLSQKINKYTSEEKDLIKKMAKSMKFKINSKYEIKSTSDIKNTIWTSIIVASITGVIVSLTPLLKKKEKVNTLENQVVPEQNNNIPAETNNNNNNTL